ncbi:MarR family transcriptional regulator [Aquihabitans sp. McL0605]|uniref:arsenate reductase/protein-tyrosine-phosphatase family protein n=1 Tax=Aquihabitans sp. McL0605 TaxID=3415671 RepID=UPI003CEC4F2C
MDLETRSRGGSPPGILVLAANPLRWAVLEELVRSDRSVRELTDRLGQPQNLVSYHLRQLRNGAVVRSRRSSADGRATYYSIDLESCRDQFRDAGAALHPALAGPIEPTRSIPPVEGRRTRVLFLCTGNSARSPMAEALLTARSDGTVDVASAGSHPKVLHPNAVRVMAERGIDIGDHRTKHIDDVAGVTFDLVITLCDRVREVCPELPGHPTPIHWSLPDPSAGAATDEAGYPAFEQTAVELERRIIHLLGQLAEQAEHPERRSHHA